MQKISYRRHRFHPDIIRRAVWLYFRFTMSFRDVEDLLAERGIDVSYETVRLWVLKFGQAYARRICKRRDPAFNVWHLDEVFVTIGGKQMYRHCHINRRRARESVLAVFQAAAVALSHTVNASVRNRLNRDLLSK